jgi:hypothetical protein
MIALVQPCLLAPAPAAVRQMRMRRHRSLLLLRMFLSLWQYLASSIKLQRLLLDVTMQQQQQLVLLQGHLVAGLWA